MYRTALRSAAPRVANPLRQSYLAASGRRFASTAPADKKRSWKSSAVRWGLAIGAVYMYSTSAVFAEEPQLRTIQPPPEFSDADLPTVEAVVARKRQEGEARAQRAAAEESKTTAEPETAALAARTSPVAPADDVKTGGEGPSEVEGGPEALQEEAAQQGAFNPETGEINWDCPCLGGMAHGPCGEQFKAAFSCFVYSNEEPKGMDCIDKFQNMQDCFREHPEVYGDELADDEQAEAAIDGPADAPEGVSARNASTEGAATSTEAPISDRTKDATPAKTVTAADSKAKEVEPGSEKPATPSSSATKKTPEEPNTTKTQ
ncbi:hypothetical protein F4777DRAFT_563458 [Nemania sp. FL0916]|nr:hypothetical protein F4777DRAFT_563458 [Nemania sp. FL0916]